MLDRSEIRHQFEFDAWANARVAAQLAQRSPVDAASERLFAHIVGVLELWLARVRGEALAQIGAWPEASLEESLRRLDDVHRRWREWIETVTADDLVRPVRFTNSAGVAQADEHGAIARQVIQHGTHHRAQIAALVRQSGATPQNVDYIVFRRTVASDPDRAQSSTAPSSALRHFVIEVTYAAPLLAIDELLAAHRAHLEQGYRTGMLLLSGPQVPRTGGVILARAKSLEELQTFIDADPFSTRGVAKYRVVEFQPTKHQDWMKAWVGVGS